MTKDKGRKKTNTPHPPHRAAGHRTGAAPANGWRCRWAVVLHHRCLSIPESPCRGTPCRQTARLGATGPFMVSTARPPGGYTRDQPLLNAHDPAAGSFLPTPRTRNVPASSGQHWQKAVRYPGRTSAHAKRTDHRTPSLDSASRSLRLPPQFPGGRSDSRTLSMASPARTYARKDRPMRCSDKTGQESQSPRPQSTSKPPAIHTRTSPARSGQT